MSATAPTIAPTQDGGRSHRVGFIGLGNLGLPIAQRLDAAGCLDAYWQRRPRRTAFSSRPVGTPDSTDLAALVDLVCVCVPDEDALFDVVDRRFLDSLRDGTILIVHSTVTPGSCVRLAEMAGARNASVVDAPVCGGPTSARLGQLLVSAGGETNDFSRCGYLFECYSQLWRHVGPVGAGQRMKLLINLLYTANVGIICDALDAGRGIGLDPELIGEFVNSHPSAGFVGGGLATGRLGDEAVAHGKDLLAKDIAYAARLFDESDGPSSVLMALATSALGRLERSVGT